MDTSIKTRAIKLQREANVSSIEARCLKLKVKESVTLSIMDLQAYQRLRTRLVRLKNETNRVYETSLDGNNVNITRKA